MNGSSSRNYQELTMATKSLPTTAQSIASMSVAEIQAKAAAIRAARKNQAPGSSDAPLGVKLGYSAANFINGFGVMRDAYSVRRAERTGL